MGGKKEVELMCMSIIMEIVILSILITPSSAQEQDASCWTNIGTCFRASEAKSAAGVPEFDGTSALFNGSDYYCCPLIADVVANEPNCFCLVDFTLPDSASFLDVLTYCSGETVTSAITADYCASYATATPSGPSPVDQTNQNVTTTAIGDTPAIVSSAPNAAPNAVGAGKRKSMFSTLLGSKAPQRTAIKKIVIPVVVVGLLALLVAIGISVYRWHSKKKPDIEKPKSKPATPNVVQS